MVRPKDACSEETWNRIVAAARQELMESDECEVDVSVRQVATRAGVSLGTIHYYFPTKESLLEACLDAYYARFGALVVELAPLTTQPDARFGIEQAARRIYGFAVSERHSLKLRARLNAELGQLEPQRARHVRGPMLDAFASLLGNMGGLGVTEARLTIQTMTGLIMHLALLADADLEQIAGVGGEAGRRIVEDHVARVALRLLFPS
ncbi:TetR/AcrR family transcriptional regulator [Polyangium mundeleinium]|uniref:TetR/AcrR family transcriptional regulator n=1 Tax=Polyangium mundeleinium TaxID=2995306 RepID=A0ABT5EKW2_9BACT|nr:TetR/AcrR family transcriptional regulator [Polyangium mundeleinium]MDC0742401.1 TetR/AcrR family transcriptional regulator [Polyangium mundeleinium]